MPVQAITGLPGSGKSCYAMKIMYEMFLDWARYEKKNGKPFERKLYTNIPLHIDAINETATNELGYDVDLSQQIVSLEESYFLRNGKSWEWWNSFDQGSFIIIDEVHQLLPAQQGNDKESKALRKSFVDYVSMHRHKQQDMIFMSQAIENVSPDIRKMIAVLFNVQNVKDMKFGPCWPFQIPMADIDVVKEAWGYATQFAHVLRGRREGNRYKYDKHCENFLMSTFLYKMYRSHTMSEAKSDRPSLKLGRIGSLIWLARRHGLRLVLSTVILFGGISAGIKTLKAMPVIVMEAIKTTAPDFETGKSTAPVSTPGNIVTEPNSDPRVAVTAPVDDAIIGFVRGGVITARGVLRKDDSITFEGEKDTVAAVDMTKGIVYFGSGKKLQK